LDVWRGALDVHQVVSDSEASSFGQGFRVYDEQREVLGPYVLFRSAGNYRVAGDARGHCARRVERALSAECARSLAPRAEPPPALQFDVRDEADDAHISLVGDRT